MLISYYQPKVDDLLSKENDHEDIRLSLRLLLVFFGVECRIRIYGDAYRFQ